MGEQSTHRTPRPSPGLAGLWVGLLVIAAGQALNLRWHVSHELEAGSGLIHNPGTLVVAIGYALVVLSAIILTINRDRRRTQRNRARDEDRDVETEGDRDVSPGSFTPPGPRHQSGRQ